MAPSTVVVTPETVTEALPPVFVDAAASITSDVSPPRNICITAFQMRPPEPIVKSYELAISPLLVMAR